MKILEIQIDRFGLFYHWQGSFDGAAFLTIYGPNEAGKSTLVNFIKCIFFGFPRKADLLPYLNDGGNPHDVGGSITLQTKQWGKLKIVRYYQRNGGKATFFNENGDVLSEEAWLSFLHGIDRDVFEAVFCFDLEGLKGIEKLKAEEFNRFLFNTGMVGERQLSDLEKSLEKQAGALFKPGGRLPLINQTLLELDALQAKLTEWKKQMDDYLTLKNQSEQLKKDIESAVSSKRDLEKQRHVFQRYKAAEPLVIDIISVKEALNQFPDLSRFPEDAKTRYDHWRTQVASYQGELDELETKMAPIKTALSQFGAEDDILQVEKQLTALQRQASERSLWEREWELRRERLRREKVVLHADLEQLGMTEDDLETLKNMPLDLDSKQWLRDEMNRWQTEAERSRAIEAACDTAEEKLRALKERRAELQNSILSEAAFQELENTWRKHQPEQLAAEKAHLEEKWMTLKKAKENAKWFSGFRIAAVLIPALFFIGFALLTLHDQPLWAGLSIILGGSFSFLVWRLFGALRERLMPQMDEKALRAQLSALEDQDAVDIHELQSVYQQEKDRRRELALVEAQIAEEEKTCRNYIQKNERIQLKLLEIEAGLREWREAIGLPEMAIALLPEAIQLAEKIRSQIQQIEELEAEAAHFKGLLADFRERYQQAVSLLDAPDLTLEEAFAWLEHAKASREKKQKLIEALEHFQDHYDTVRAKCERAKMECQKLLELSGAETEEAFYRFCSLYVQKKEKEKQLQSLVTQLRHLAPRAEDRKQYFAWLSDGYWEGVSDEDFLKQLDELESHIKHLQQKLADAESQIKHMEKDETYPELLHDYKEKQYVLNDLAKKWGTIRTAQAVLNEAKERYQATRLPALLKRASLHFSNITAGKYVKLYYNEGDGFLVERSDGVIFSAASLSRGTREQLYLSLRLSLMDLMETDEAWPLIVDDGFVNFDAKRLNQVMEIFRQIGNRRQILFFTCHRHGSSAILELTNQRREGDRSNVGSIISDTAR